MHLSQYSIAQFARSMSRFLSSIIFKVPGTHEATIAKQILLGKVSEKVLLLHRVSL
jgi:hypothetical protein